MMGTAGGVALHIEDARFRQPVTADAWLAALVDVKCLRHTDRDANVLADV